MLINDLVGVVTLFMLPFWNPVRVGILARFTRESCFHLTSGNVCCEGEVLVSPGLFCTTFVLPPGQGIGKAGAETLAININVGGFGIQTRVALFLLHFKKHKVSA